MKNVKNVIAFLILSIFLFSSVAAIAAPAFNSLASNDTIVYITRTGSKYHQSWCSYLRKSKIAITLEEAKAEGYTPCKRCKPPQ